MIQNWKSSVKNLFRRLLRRGSPPLPLSQLSMTTQATDGSPSTAQILTESETLVIIRSIKDLPLRHFIECCCYEKYGLLVSGKTLLTEPEVVEIGKAWTGLLSEYHQVKGDKEATAYFKLLARQKAIEIRQKRIGIITEGLKVMYTPGACDALRQDYPDLEFTVESYLQDINAVAIGEVEYQIELDEINAELKDLQKNEGKEVDAKTKEKGFYSAVMDLNQIEHGSYNVETMSTYTYALGLERIQNHIEHLKRQNIKGNGR